MDVYEVLTSSTDTEIKEASRNLVVAASGYIACVAQHEALLAIMVEIEERDQWRASVESADATRRAAHNGLIAQLQAFGRLWLGKT